MQIHNCLKTLFRVDVSKSFFQFSCLRSGQKIGGDLVVELHVGIKPVT